MKVRNDMKWIIITPFWLFTYTFLIFISFYYLFKNNIPYHSWNPNSHSLILGLNDIIPFSDQKTPLNTYNTQDIRIQSLVRFFSNINSPLANYSEEIVKNADIYGIDYALVPAISMQESNACKYIPVDSYNCWGFGIYGSKVTRFKSFSEAIARVTKTIKETYIKKGLTNPTLLEDRWTPQSKGTWSYAVNYYMTLIHNIERNTPFP